MLTLEVIVRGSSNFIGFPDICWKALLDAGFVVMLLFVLHLLGSLLEIGSRSLHFAAFLFYKRISRGPKLSTTSASLQLIKIPSSLRKLSQASAAPKTNEHDLP